MYEILTEVWKFWLVAGIIFMIAEGLTPASFSLFFGGLGALATALVCYFFPRVEANWTYQLLIFSGMSLFSLILLRPRFLRFLHSNKIKLDGPEAFLGKRAKVLSNLQSNCVENGKVLFEGTEWSAAPVGDSPDISPGSIVEVVQMEGLTLYVKLVQPESK